MEGIFPPKCLSLIQNNELVSTENKQVDALSRNAVCMVTRSQSKITSKIATAQEADERMQLLKTLVEKELKDDYHIKENVLYVQVDGRELIVIPETMELEVIHGTGVKMRNKTDLRIKEILDQEFLHAMIQEKETIRMKGIGGNSTPVSSLETHTVFHMMKTTLKRAVKRRPFIFHQEQRLPSGEFVIQFWREYTRRELL
ncbi:hypothetical protein HNY73_009036 [Argiope bruennichi]|uniref:Uncharacterized protein n=1 Tax=Argiope bruennichi TaxID=94029 RepID=A0A8T0FAZ4_ARGBR|nr:hypothetical protein HNY73_009036 [Argiope bruennichi]